MSLGIGETEIVTILVSVVGNYVFVKEAIAILKVKAERLEKDMDAAFTKIRELEKINNEGNHK